MPLASVHGTRVLNRLLGGVGLAIGVLSLLAGDQWAARRTVLVRGAVATAGTVVANTDVRYAVGSNASLHSYCPVVQFVTRDGDTVTYQDAACAVPATFSVGQSVLVRYDPVSPHRAAVDRGSTRDFAIPAACAMFGVLFAIAGVQRMRR